MFSDWSRPKLGLATHAGQEVVHRKPPQATRGWVIASYCVDNPCCPYEQFDLLINGAASSGPVVDPKGQLISVYSTSYCPGGPTNCQKLSFLMFKT